MILVFLQNAWGVEDGYLPTFERESFAKCVTGKRLKKMLPKDEDVVIRNCTPLVGEESESNIKPDKKYIAMQIDILKPDKILACGRNARILKTMKIDIPVTYAYHPAYRILKNEYFENIKDLLSN